MTGSRGKGSAFPLEDTGPYLMTLIFPCIQGWMAQK